jgi:hypothetical protein
MIADDRAESEGRWAKLGDGVDVDVDQFGPDLPHPETHSNASR